MLKKFFIFLILIVIIGGIYAFKLYQDISTPNVKIQDSPLLYVNTESTLDDVLKSLMNENQLIDTSSFLWVAQLMKFKNPKPGRYRLKADMSNRSLISLLRSGKQEPLSLTFNNMRTIEELSGYYGHMLESDSIAFINYFTSKEALDKSGLDKENILSVFIPNTYEVYWNTSPQNLFAKLFSENEKFWNSERMAQLETLNLSKDEVYTLASIVQKETNLNAEKPTIAGVYLNRLKRGQLLQADPTVVFATGDFGIRRVLNKHIIIDSPYNTYKYEGLPPGPIFMPDVSSIDAVLNPEQHSYLYFCASPDNSGKHQFAKTLIEHNRNANKYRNWLNQRNIYK